MAKPNLSLHATLLAGSMLAASPVSAADVTPQRLLNPDKEPQNWLMNHRTYDGQRFSPLARINKDNVKNLKLAYAVPLAGTPGGEFIEATPLAEDGFLYITDSWSVLYKIDASAGRRRPHRLAHGSQAGAAGRQSRRRPLGQPRHLARERAGPHHRDRQELPARWCGNPTYPTPTASPSPARRSPSRTRSSSAPPAATAAPATGWRRSTPRPASCCGASTPFPRRASRAAKPGRTRTTPGRPAAAPCG